MRLRFLLAVLLAACSQPAPDDAGFAEAARVAQDVVAANVMPWVERLAADHLADVKVSCEGFDPIEGLPTCDLSRDAAVPLVMRAFTELGLTPRTEILGEGPHAAFNVVAELPGTVRPSEVVLVGAHLDAYFGGADDNSSAVAAMIEAARALSRHRLARTVRFVAFDLEDFGAIGSTRYVEAGLADDVVAAVILDCVGFASHEPGSQTSPTGMPLGDVGDFLLVAGNEDSSDLLQRMVAFGNGRGLLKLKGILGAGDGTSFFSTALMRSDNGLLWVRGVPALLLSDTANFRNKNYHEPTDLPETLDPDFLVGVTRVLAGSVALFAEVQP